MWCASWATPHSQLHGAIQRVACRQDSTLKPLVVPLHVFICASKASSCCKHDMGIGYSFMVKFGNIQKSAHPQTCKVLRPWAFVHKTMVLALLVNRCYSYRAWVYMYILLECHVIRTDNWLATILRCFVWKSDMVLVMIAWKVYNFQLKPILRSLAPLFHTEKLSLP